MKEHTSTQKEKRFVLLTLLTAAACAALVFWFAVPLKGHTGQTAQPEPMIQAARVDLNTAGLDALCTLPGIGEKKARAILDYRQQNGAFRHVEDVFRGLPPGSWSPGKTLHMLVDNGSRRCWRKGETT